MRNFEGKVVDCQLREMLESMHPSNISNGFFPYIPSFSVIRKVYRMKVGNEYRTAVSFADAPNIPEGTRVIIEERGKILKEYFLKTETEEIPIIYFL